MRLKCSVCWGVTDIAPVAYRQRRKAGLPWSCPYCRANLMETGGPPDKKGRSDNQKRSKKQEEGVANRTGSRRQKASGSLSGAKGDVRAQGKMRGECKFTRAKSFSLKLEELKKIERETGNEEIPAFFIEFQCQQPPGRYVVVPEWVYLTLTEGPHE